MHANEVRAEATCMVASSSRTVRKNLQDRAVAVAACTCGRSQKKLFLELQAGIVLLLAEKVLSRVSDSMHTSLNRMLEEPAVLKLAVMDDPQDRMLQ